MDYLEHAVWEYLLGQKRVGVRIVGIANERHHIIFLVFCKEFKESKSDVFDVFSFRAIRWENMKALSYHVKSTKLCYLCHFFHQQKILKHVFIYEASILIYRSLRTCSG